MHVYTAFTADYDDEKKKKTKSTLGKVEKHKQIDR
jgi:hypothetical protein